MLAHVLAMQLDARRAQPASGRVHREQLSSGRQRARAGELAPNATRVHFEPPPLQQSIRTRAVRGRSTATTARIDARPSGTRGPSEEAHRPSPRRPYHTHARASPSVLPQTTPHRRSVEPTSCWRQERRGHHHARPHSQWRGRRRPSARAAARGVAVVITTAARSEHVEHVGAAGRRPARACAAVWVAETLHGSHPGPGPPAQSAGAAGEPLQRSA